MKWSGSVNPSSEKSKITIEITDHSSIKIPKILGTKKVGDNCKKNVEKIIKIEGFHFFSPLRSLKFNCSFGLRMHPICNKLQFHSGVDLKAHFEPVFAIADGLIKKASYGIKEGYFIIIVHGAVESIYCHLQKLYFTNGDSVKGGDCIGISGNSGRSTGPHLHFGIKYYGVAVNPIDYLKQF